MATARNTSERSSLLRNSRDDLTPPLLSKSASTMLTSSKSAALLSTIAVVFGLSAAAYAEYIHFPFGWRPFGMGSLPDLYEASIEEIQDGLKRRRFTSVGLVKASRTNPLLPVLPLLTWSLTGIPCPYRRGQLAGTYPARSLGNQPECTGASC